jgi:tetratricopeptide (TPR) repeat protein
MNKFAKIISLLSIVLIFISGCNDKGTDSPFGEILSQPPYAEISDSIKQEPKNDKLYFNRAVLLNTNNLPEPALADFKKAWSIKKDEKYAFGISNLLLDKKTDSAINFLREALTELPGSFLLQLTLVRSLNEENKTEEALQLANQILLSNPDQVDLLKIKAELLEKNGNPADAISVLERAYNLTPYDIDLNYNLAYKYGEYKNAKVIALCDSLIKIDTLGLHAEPYYYKGIYFSNINDKAKALSLFDQAIQHDYYYLNAYIEKGKVLFNQKKISDALKTFQLANTISPKFPDAWFWLAKCQEAMGQKEEALLNYQRAFALDNGFTEAKEAADKLK